MLNFSRNTALKLTSLTLISQGLNFLDTLYKLWTERKFSLQAFDPECIKWLLLLLQLVDVTGDNPAVYLRRFLLGRTGVVKKYRQDITKYVRDSFMICNKEFLIDILPFIQVIEVVHRNFPRLTVQQFFPLYKSFHIWPTTVKECELVYHLMYYKGSFWIW